MEQENRKPENTNPTVSVDDFDETIANMDRSDYLFLLQEIEHR